MNYSKVQQVLRDGEKDTEDYATEIAKLQSRIISIQQKKDRLEVHLRAYASLIAPVRRLPDDVLREVFKYDCSEPCKLFLLRIRDGPLKVGAVCSHWRSIVVSTPSLWSRISLRVGLEPFSSTCHVLQLFLDRSKQVALELVVNFFCSDGIFQEDPAFRAIASEAHRWTKLSVHGSLYPVSSKTSWY
ncbi:hypothetical protein BT96DRAFT_817156 [Gymnopus androsaceus JB14]|uniref:F-box domain-containing protein n=1 Tax=Gymnopus androsaceus JB14 TaxID=1447944 RepID=A0A6A4HVN7_9AGAR|nr:hypothetical protein BT96DRAFT_817156 [Gymnopus androsaceus JB14]